jgi:hypothetical protein
MNDLNLKNGSKLEKIRISKISQTRQNWKCWRLGLIEPVHGRYCHVQNQIRKRNKIDTKSWLPMCHGDGYCQLSLRPDREMLHIGNRISILSFIYWWINESLAVYMYMFFCKLIFSLFYIFKSSNKDTICSPMRPCFDKDTISRPMMHWSFVLSIWSWHGWIDLLQYTQLVNSWEKTAITFWSFLLSSRF